MIDGADTSDFCREVGGGDGPRKCCRGGSKVSSCCTIRPSNSYTAVSNVRSAVGSSLCWSFLTSDSLIRSSYRFHLCANLCLNYLTFGPILELIFLCI